MKKVFKKIALVFLCAVFLFSVCSCGNENDTQSDTDVSADQDNGKWLLKTKIRNNGNWREDYTYDKHGNLIHVDGKSELDDYTADYRYDDNRNLIYGESISTDFHTKDSYKYDERGNLIEHKNEMISLSYQWPDNENTITYTYDLQNRILTKEYNKGREIYSYNEDGSYKIETYTSTDIWVNTVYYDSEERVIGSEGREGSGEVKYTFDESGKISATSAYSNGVLADLTEFKYDEYGNLISKATTLGDGTKSDLRYEYDENGNCITTRKFEADGTSMIVEECEYIFITFSE